MKLKCVFFLLLISLRASNAANILGLLSSVSPSHYLWKRSLMLALASRGHNVTVLTTQAEKIRVPNYTQYVIESEYSPDIDLQKVTEYSHFTHTEVVKKLHIIQCNRIFSAESTRHLFELANSTKFDLIVAYMSRVECLLGFVHTFNSPPWIGVTSSSHPLWVSYMTGNPHNPAYVPEITSSFTDHMDFWERVYNTAYYLYSVLMYEWSYIPSLDAMVREYFGEGVPSIRDIKNNVSLVMVNTHISFDHPRPLLPAVVEVGGLHIGPNKTLPQHLKIPMDEAKGGFIYFSLGSNYRSNEMSAERRQVFLDAFSRLPYKVFWKWESDSLPGQPSNVIVSKWMPQRDILAHPNVLLFITHNGLLSTQEAIYEGVPVIGVPIAADQKHNAVNSKAHGFAEFIDYKTVTVDHLLAVIRKVVDDKRNKENARRLSKLMRDQPQSPLERAVFWTEYVIRHKGAPHLRSAAADLPLYQYLLLDVVCVLAAGVLGVLLLLYKICRAFVALARPGGHIGKLKMQ